MSGTRTDDGERAREDVWTYPRPPRLEATERRIRVVMGGVTIADSTRSLRVLETGHPPVYYVPPDDVAMEHLRPSDRTTFCEWKGHARYYDIEVDGQRSENAAWYYPAPTEGWERIRDHVAFYPAAVDECWVDDERVEAQRSDFYGGWVTSEITGRPFRGEPGA